MADLHVRFVQISLQWILQCVFGERIIFPFSSKYHLLYLVLEQYHEHFVSGKKFKVLPLLSLPSNPGSGLLDDAFISSQQVYSHHHSPSPPIPLFLSSSLCVPQNSSFSILSSGSFMSIGCINKSMEICF